MLFFLLAEDPLLLPKQRAENSTSTQSNRETSPYQWTKGRKKGDGTSLITKYHV